MASRWRRKNSSEKYCRRSNTKNAAMPAATTTRTTSFPLFMRRAPWVRASITAASRHAHGSRPRLADGETRPRGDAPVIRGVRRGSIGPRREETAYPPVGVVAQRQRLDVHARGAQPEHALRPL